MTLLRTRSLHGDRAVGLHGAVAVVIEHDGTTAVSSRCGNVTPRS